MVTAVTIAFLVGFFVHELLQEEHAVSMQSRTQETTTSSTQTTLPLRPAKLYIVAYAYKSRVLYRNWFGEADIVIDVFVKNGSNPLEVTGIECFVTLVTGRTIRGEIWKTDNGHWIMPLSNVQLRIVRVPKYIPANGAGKISVKLLWNENYRPVAVSSTIILNGSKGSVIVIPSPHGIEVKTNGIPLT